MIRLAGAEGRCIKTFQASGEMNPVLAAAKRSTRSAVGDDTGSTRTSDKCMRFDSKDVSVAHVKCGQCLFVSGAGQNGGQTRPDTNVVQDDGANVC